MIGNAKLTFFNLSFSEPSSFCAFLACRCSDLAVNCDARQSGAVCS